MCEFVAVGDLIKKQQAQIITEVVKYFRSFEGSIYKWLAFSAYLYL